MTHPSRALVLLLVGIGVAVPLPSVFASSPDDPFYDWDLERYRIERSPTDPTGGILPLPERPAEPGRTPSPRAVGWSAGFARVTQEIAEEEADGARIRDGFWTRLTIDHCISLPSNLRVGLAGRFFAGEGAPTAGAWLERNLALQGGKVEILLGMTRSVWGDGNEGSILLGRTAPPLQMIRIRSVRPWTVPSTASIARFHASIFLAYLDDRYRTIPFPLLQGTRLEWEPSAFTRLSFSRTILLGGAGRTEKLTGSDIWDMWWGEGENLTGPRDVSDTDQKASIGLELRLPPLDWTPSWFEGARFFYEYAGEDALQGALPTAVAHLTGGSAAFAGWLALAEFSETVDDANWWYTNHTVYGPGSYYFRGYVMGHPMETNGTSGHLRIWTPEKRRIRAQAWLRARGHYDHDLRRTTWWEENAGVRLGKGLSAGRMLETGFETYRIAKGTDVQSEPPIRWRVTVALRVGAVKPPDALTAPAPGW
jgi:hypothetical protein